MTKLLVSVRDGDEATAALLGKAHLIDVKEPQQGSLGAASKEAWQQVANRLPESTPMSVAGGELQSFDWESISDLPQRVSLLKVGLSHSKHVDWPLQLATLSRRLPDHCQLVTVIYADGHACMAPGAATVLEVAQQLSSPVLLIDTFHKDGRNVFDHVDVSQIAEWFEVARQQQMMTVLAGSIHSRILVDAWETNPDVIAVRGAVCRRDRNGVVDQQKVEQFLQAMHSVSERQNAS